MHRSPSLNHTFLWGLFLPTSPYMGLEGPPPVFTPFGGLPRPGAPQWMGPCRADISQDQISQTKNQADTQTLLVQEQNNIEEG